MLKIDSVSKKFGGMYAIKDVSFSVNENEITGLIGPNGAGKTTLFSLITGFYVPSGGSIYFEGENITGLSPHLVAEKGLCRTFQIVQTFKELTVRENIRVGAFLKYPKPKDALKKADEIMERLGITHKADKKASSLTLAECKKIEMARVLATEPKIILLDEVMAGLTSTEVQGVIEFIRKLKNEKITFLIVEHVMDAIMALSDKIVVLNYGTKIAEGHPTFVSNDKNVIKAYLGDEDAAFA